MATNPPPPPPPPPAPPEQNGFMRFMGTHIGPFNLWIWGAVLLIGGVAAFVVIPRFMGKQNGNASTTSQTSGTSGTSNSGLTQQQQNFQMLAQAGIDPVTGIPFAVEEQINPATGLPNYYNSSATTTPPNTSVGTGPAASYSPVTDQNVSPDLAALPAPAAPPGQQNPTENAGVSSVLVHRSQQTFLPSSIRNGRT